ncbi:hypothetical protein TPHA_0B04590 [Tetrapisispora phaffii CBS 4417]|uniref:Kinetochore protein SPC25 n=1 Tax=Tetrapisispora phaffii (strain ATCC 24235 / CBS 4417 / NBRC 1672 / NRRL Y-8282 / UCD 70-5) TaxID=1071381 RepID=G8BQ47_TETPH|nr:hypothetical protein TPHA_0B04590 [Tetrapisispora phaffii CBS 4417]CCE62128.1 hypothetical protein TPHA_0B04590 [Tetrapisispora phaffii CBS 4417]
MSSTMNDFELLKERMNNFTDTLDMYLDEKVSMAKDLTEDYRASIDALNARSQELAASIQLTQTQIEEMTSQIEVLEAANDTRKTDLLLLQLKSTQLLKNREVLLKETDDVDALLQDKMDKIKRLKEFYLKQNHQDNPEVSLYEKLLGLTIDTSEAGTLRFNFHKLTETQSKVPAYVVLDVSKQEYQILNSVPAIDANSLASILGDLNKTNNIAQFLLSTREQLQQSLTQ